MINYIYILVIFLSSNMYFENKRASIEIELNNNMFYVEKNKFKYKILFANSEIKKGQFLKHYNFGIVSGNLVSKMGEMTFLLNDTINKRTISGQFINCPDTLKRLAYTINPENFEDEKVVVDEYFQPLMSGKWIYIDNVTNDTLVVNYVHGILKR